MISTVETSGGAPLACSENVGQLFHTSVKEHLPASALPHLHVCSFHWLFTLSHSTTLTECVSWCHFIVDQWSLYMSCITKFHQVLKHTHMWVKCVNVQTWLLAPCLRQQEDERSVHPHHLPLSSGSSATEKHQVYSLVLKAAYSDIKLSTVISCHLPQFSYFTLSIYAQ